MLDRWEKDTWHAEAFSIAMRYANLGDLDSAFTWINKCIDLRSTELIASEARGAVNDSKRSFGTSN